MTSNMSEADMLTHVSAALAAGIVRIELDSAVFSDSKLVRVQCVDPDYPRRKPTRVFPIADVIVTDSWADTLRTLATLIERATDGASDAV